MKVLLAEDEPDVQLIARLSLKKAGFTVVTATTVSKRSSASPRRSRTSSCSTG